MFFKKKDYIKEIENLIADEKFAKLEPVLDKFFEENKENIIALSHVGFILFQNRIVTSYHGKVFGLYPSNILPTTIFLTNMLAAEDNFDEATLLARKYLKETLDYTDNLKNIPPELAQYTIQIHLGLGLGILHLTSAYTSLGSLNHSLRLINYGLALGLDKKFTERLAREKELLLSELSQDSFKQTDQIWEDFWMGFCRGDMSKKYSLDFVQNKVSIEKYPNMSKRIELIESRIRYAQFFDEIKEEFFLQVLKVNDNTFTLM